MLPHTLLRPLYIAEPLALLIAGIAAAIALGGPQVIIALCRDALSYHSGIIVGAVIGMILHELAHKYYAIREGCRASYVLTPFGLTITLLSGLIPFIAIISPGYVTLMCYPTSWLPREPREDLIAASGIATNLILSFVARLAHSITPFHLHPFLAGFAQINAWMAFFNLLPIPPLDGHRIISGMAGVWLAMFVASILMIFL